MDGNHLDGCDGGFEAFVAGFEAGAVEGLFEGFAGEDAEGVGDTGVLLGLADAAGDFVINGLVVGGFATEETAEGDDGVELFGFGERSGRGGDLPCTGDPDDLDVFLRCSAAVEGVERALQEAVGDDGVPAGGDDGEGHADCGEVAFDGVGAVVEGVLGLPEAYGERLGLLAGYELEGEEAGVPVGEGGLGEDGGDVFGAVVGEEPLVDGGVDVVQLRGLDEERRYGWGAAGDELQVADGREEGGTLAGAVLPAFAGLKAEGEEEGGELGEGLRGGDGVD